MKQTLSKWHNEIDTFLTQSNFETQFKDQHHPFFENEENFEHLQIPNFEDLEDANDKIILLFSRLSLCYEYGLLLEHKENNFYTIPLGFDHGQIFSFEESKSIPLPIIKHNEIYKLKSLEWFEKWNIKGLGQTKDFTHLLFQPWPKASMIFSTQLADPWLKVQAEKTLDYLIKHTI